MMQNFRDIDTTAVSVALRIVYYAGMCLQYFHTSHTHIHIIIYVHAHAHTHIHMLQLIYINFIVSGKTP